MKLYSDEQTKITDGNNNYQLEKFVYTVDNKKLKGEKILVITDNNLPKSDKYFFESGFFNLSKRIYSKKCKNFITPNFIWC